MTNPVETCCKVSFLYRTPIKVYDFVIPHVETLEDVLHVMECHDNLPKDSTVKLVYSKRLDDCNCVSNLRVRSVTGETWDFTFTYEFLKMVS
jgi:hypothetical protein